MDNEVLKYISNNEENTYNLGLRLGELVEPGQIVLLAGDLGAGKTILTQGIAEGLGVEDDITSPTYNLINEYEGELEFFHMDLYRLEIIDDLYELGFEEYLDREGVIVIEWPDLAYDLLPPEFLYIKINVLTETKREISLEAEGVESLKLLERLGKYVGIRD